MEIPYSNVIIAGLGISGIAAANLLSGKVDDLVLYDGNKDFNVEGIKDRLVPDFNGRFVLGELSDEEIKKCELLIISPGVPTDLPFVIALKENGAVVWGEAELGLRASKGRLAAITGTNGKTTTTALLGEICRTQFESVHVVGNIGIPITQMAPETKDETVTVAEMSSFQLESVEAFHPQVSMILNITPDHLNRHYTMENYTLAKANIMLNQNENETCILNYEDARLRELEAKSKAKVKFFSSVREVPEGMYVENERFILKENGVKTDICSVYDMNIIGKHNYENAMAAMLGAFALGVTKENVLKALKTFVAVEHRIEYTATKNGVKYYNDSKGTNPDASIQAVRAMSTKTILIGGGYDKGSSYDEWIETFGDKIKCLLLMGQTAEKIAECCEKHGFKDYKFVESMEEAVDYSYKNALPGEAVLLSPCCASWGMFKNYEERGRIFKELVKALPE